MTRITIDTSELGALAADLTKAGSGIDAKVRPVVHRGASNIKATMRAAFGASRSFKGVTSAVDYSMGGGMIFGVGLIEAEIGPRKGSPGSLANVAIYGTSRGGGTVADPQLALDAEEPGFVAALGDILEETL